MASLKINKRPQGSCPPSARRVAATLAPQPVDRGVDFVGQVIKPWHRYTRKRSVKEAIKQVKSKPDAELYESANSYFGLLTQATSSHKDRCKLANVLRHRGHTINKAITKTYRKSA